MNDPHSIPAASLDPTWEAEVREVGPIAVDLDCDECGAHLRWDPSVDALSCEHCGSVRPVARGGETIVERPLEEAEHAARGFGLDLLVVRCGACGARVAFQESTTSTECAFCGSPQLLAPEERRNPLRPESVIPLDVDAQGVRAAFTAWVKGRWFRPNALRAVRDFEASGIYVPAWTYDARVRSEWSADSGTYYYVTVPRTVLVNGRPTTRMVRERRVRWRPASGSRQDVYDDLQVLASRGLRRDLAQELGPFDTRALVPFRPEYLAGWRAEEYQIDLLEGFEEARRRIEAEQRERCARDVPGDTHRNLRVHNQLSDVRWKHVLLPLWTLNYRFRGKVYPVVVQGHNGRVAGEAPYSWVKILLAVLALLALAGGVAWVANSR